MMDEEAWHVGRSAKSCAHLRFYCFPGVSSSMGMYPRVPSFVCTASGISIQNDNMQCIKQ